MAGAAFFVVMFVIGYLLYSRPRAGAASAEARRRSKAGHREGRERESREDVWIQKLLLITRGNRGAIERGVLAQRRRLPRATRAELLERLYREYLRDRS